MTRPQIFVVAMLACVGCLVAGLSYGEDFRVDNSVYLNDEKTPTTESVTICHEGVVYDCMKKPAETVVFDQAADRFVLLNSAQRTRTELTTGEVAAFVDRLQPVAAKSKDSVTRFFAKPEFQESFDAASDELTLSGPQVVYRMTLTHEASPSVVEQYHVFSDWYARLNALLVPGSRPPFARLVVNAAVAKRKAMATQVVLTITTSKGLMKHEKTTIRSEHHVGSILDAADMERIVATREAMGSFKLVPFEQYQKLEAK